MSVRTRLKHKLFNAVFFAGRRLGGVAHHRINTIHGFLDLGLWSASFGDLPPDHVSRERLFLVALNRVQQSASPLYLEFGVYQGASLHWWSDHLETPGATLIGFDSFEGLPENWNVRLGKGDFAVSGVPQIDDSRVSFQVGWFETTVPSFEVPEHDALIVNIDSDLYSSAALVLNRMEPHLTAGAVLFFDEFNDRDHELRALREFLSRTGKTVRPLGTAEGRSCWLFEVAS
jgi:hypothetical protein